MAVLTALLGALMPAISPPAQAQEFEVAVVKPHASGAPCGESNAYPGGRLVLSCFTLYTLLREALDLSPGDSDELRGGPDWARSELWDVTAKAESDARELKPAEYRPMLRSLAEQRST